MAFLIRQLWLFIVLALLSPAFADDNLQLAEQEIKAGLLYNFLKYTEWPADRMEKSPSMMVCIFGDDPLGEYLQPMAGRTVNQRLIVIRKIQAIGDVQNCHLLFIDADEKDRWGELRDSLKKQPILTVSDFKGFVDSGGMIEFGRKENRISVELNSAAVTAVGLRMQDRLLKLVTVVNPGSQEGR